MFPIFYLGEECGNARLETQGLYCRIICQCRIPTQVICKIKLIADGNVFALGTCIKEGNRYIIDTKLPLKYIQGKKLKFLMHADGDQWDFYPIDENKAFPHLRSVHKARMAYRNGKVGIILTE